MSLNLQRVILQLTTLTEGVTLITCVQTMEDEVFGIRKLEIDLALCLRLKANLNKYSL